jgi:hypothetical protein
MGIMRTKRQGVLNNSLSDKPDYTPNIGNQFVYYGSTIDPTPFHIKFSWDEKTVDVTLKDGNDIFKLANALTKWLDKNKIEYNIKTSKRKK